MLNTITAGAYNRNTLWLRDTVRQTSRGKSAAAGPTAGRPRPLTSRGMSAWPYRVTTKYSFYPVRTFKMLNKKMIALTVLWTEKYSDLMANYLSILVWRRLPSELTSPVEWSPTLCSISQRTAPGPQKAKIWILIYSIPSDEENRIKITRILSINALLSPSLRNVWGFLIGPCVLLHCSNQRLDYYAARGKPLWRHNGFCDVINAQSRQNKRAHP